MTPVSLNAALGAPVDSVAGMLADKAESFAEYYLHGAAPSRSINPDPRDFIRKKADDAGDIAATLRQPVGFVALSIAAKLSPSTVWQRPGRAGKQPRRAGGVAPHCAGSRFERRTSQPAGNRNRAD
jgi:hypothetical protein